MDAIKNFAKVTASTGYNSAATSIVLSSGDGAKLPAVPFNLVWWNVTDFPDPSDDTSVEIVRVTAIATDTLTITRAQEGTSASNKNTAGKTYKLIQGPTAKTITDTWVAPTITSGLTVSTGVVTISDSSASTAASTGALRVTGGAWFGDKVVMGASVANPSNQGQLTVNGGNTNQNVIQCSSGVSNTNPVSYYNGPAFFYQITNTTNNNTATIDFRNSANAGYAAFVTQCTNNNASPTSGKIYLVVANNQAAAWTQGIVIHASGGVSFGLDSDPGAGVGKFNTGITIGSGTLSGNAIMQAAIASATGRFISVANTNGEAWYGVDAGGAAYAWLASGTAGTVFGTNTNCPVSFYVNSSLRALSIESGAALVNTQVYARSTQASTSTSTGGLRVDGGAGVAGAIYGGAEIKSVSATGGIGYATGAGGTVTQTGSANAGVTLNKICGTITMYSGTAVIAGNSVGFTVTNSAVAATDTVVVGFKSGVTLDSYNIEVDAVAAGSFHITLRNKSAGNLSEVPVINFAVIKAVNA